MDASPAARRIAFAVIVCALAALGAYLLAPGARHDRGAGPAPAAARPPGRAASPPPPAGPAPPAPARSSAAPGTARRSAGHPAAAAPGPAGIYQWLPFSPAGLNAAAAVTVRFAGAYGTWSYREDGAAYAASLRPAGSARLIGQLEAAYEAPGVAAARRAGHQAATATAAISAIRAIGPGSLTFVVRVTQRLAGTAGPARQVTGYAVTVSGSGMSWQVSDIEPAAAGNS